MIVLKMAMRKKKRISKVKTESKGHVFLKSCTNICLISCYYEHNQLLLSLMLSPTLHPLNNPYNIQHFIGKLPEAFINKATI